MIEKKKCFRLSSIFILRSFPTEKSPANAEAVVCLNGDCLVCAQALRWYTALYLSIHPFNSAFSLWYLPLHRFCFLLWNVTFPSTSAVIGFRVNWDRSGDQQISSACFSHKGTYAYKYTHTVHTETVCLLCTYIYTFIRARLDCCHGSLPNEVWDDSWNSDIIMHHRRGPRKSFHFKREKTWLAPLCQRQLNGLKSALIWCLIFLTPEA